jgi:hypothetical protein
MERAVLTDDGATVDAYDFTVGESLADDAQSFGVEVGLGIGGNEDSAVDNQIVGIGGRQSIDG